VTAKRKAAQESNICITRDARIAVRGTRHLTSTWKLSSDDPDLFAAKSQLVAENKKTIEKKVIDAEDISSKSGMKFLESVVYKQTS
jgi:hypothetical protein